MDRVNVDEVNYEQRNPRDIYIDFLRFFAIVAVVYIHASALENFGKLSVVSIINILCRFCVPTFFFVSGYSLILNDMIKKNDTSFLFFMFYRLKKIGRPFLIWSLIYEIELFIVYRMIKLSNYNPYAKFDINTIILTIFTGHSKYHLYFIVVLVQLYLMYKLLYETKSFSKISTVLASLAISFLSTAYIYVYPKKMEIVQYSFLPWIFFFVFGMWFASNKMNKEFCERYDKTIFSIGLFLFIVGLIYLFYELIYGSIGINNSRISVIIYSTGFVLFVSSLLNEGDIFYIYISNIRQRIAFLGKGSFAVYLLHPLILDIIWVFTHKIFHILYYESVIYVLLITILSIISCYIIYEVASKYFRLEGILW